MCYDQPASQTFGFISQFLEIIETMEFHKSYATQGKHNLIILTPMYLSVCMLWQKDSGI